MEYEEYTAPSPKIVTVGEKIVEYDNEIWQISNITGVRNHYERITLDEPEPVFNEVKPKIMASYLWSLFAIGGGVYMGSLIQDDVVFIGLAVLFLIIFIHIYVKRKELRNWKKNKKQHDKVHQIWHDLKYGGFTIHSLVMVTNSGEKPVLYSFEDGVITKIMAEIKRAMLKPSNKKNTFKIKVVENNGTTVNNIGSTIYEQRIKEVH